MARVLILSCAKNDSVEIAETIIERETGDHSWSLRHRFDLATDLLDRVAPESPQELALIFVWLRFSAVRQLDCSGASTLSRASWLTPRTA